MGYVQNTDIKRVTLCYLPTPRSIDAVNIAAALPSRSKHVHGLGLTTVLVSLIACIHDRRAVWVIIKVNVVHGSVDIHDRARFAGLSSRRHQDSLVSL